MKAKTGRKRERGGGGGRWGRREGGAMLVLGLVKSLLLRRKVQSYI
jgi:hypothetical protein